MKLAYNPLGQGAYTPAPAYEDDIIFDLVTKVTYVKGVPFYGKKYEYFKKHTSPDNTGGSEGLVPAPSYTTTNNRLLREDGEWVHVPGASPPDSILDINSTNTVENQAVAKEIQKLNAQIILKAEHVYRNIVVNGVLIQAQGTNDTLGFIQGDGIALTPNPDDKTIIISTKVLGQQGINTYYTSGQLVVKVDDPYYNHWNETYNWYRSVTDEDTDVYINKWQEIVDFLNNVQSGTNILDEFVTRKTPQEIIGAKTFTQPITSSVTDTSPFIINSPVRVLNLNVDMLDNYHMRKWFDNASEIDNTAILWQANGTVTDISSMSYASVINVIGDAGRRWQIWNSRNNHQLYWRPELPDMSGYAPEHILLDSLNYKGFIEQMYWANIQIQSVSDPNTSPTFLNATTTGMLQTNLIRDLAGNWLLGQDPETANLSIGTAAKNHYIALQTTTADNEVFINDQGNTGIGTKTPIAKLHVVGTTRLDGQNYIISFGRNYSDAWSDGTNTHPWYGYDNRYPDTGVYSTVISDYYGMTLKTAYCNLSITTSNVGIGTYNPNSKLHVHGGCIMQSVSNNWLSPAYLQIGRVNSSVYSNSAVIGITDGNLHLDAYPNKAIYLNYYQPPGTTEGQVNTALVVRAGGNVGIGTGNPTFKLQVIGLTHSSLGYTVPSLDTTNTNIGYAVYSSDPSQYGMMMTGISTLGTHGGITDWATYFCMNTYNSSNIRGWIFRNSYNGTNVVSINTNGLITTNYGIQVGPTSDVGWYIENGRIAAGKGVARGVNVGNLLVSNTWADYTKVPTNGIYSKGNILSSGSVTALQFIANASAGPHFTGTSTAGNWAYLRLNNSSVIWDIATRSNSGSGGLWLSRYSGGDNGIFVSANSTPKVGINTSSPSYPLHVTGDSYATGWSRAGSGFYIEGKGVHYMSNGNGIGQLYLSGNNEFNISTSYGTNDYNLFFNYRAPSNGNAVRHYIWNAGSTTSYANHTMGNGLFIGNISAAAIGTSDASSAALEVREYQRGTTSITHSLMYAPRIGFHWGSRYWGNIIFFDSTFRFMNTGATAYNNVQANTFIGNLSGNASSASALYTGSASGSSHANALQTYFNANKASIPRNKTISFYSSAYSNGSQYMGYFLSGYDSNPYGGFFVAHYGTPYYVGILNGSYVQSTILTTGNYTSTLDGRYVNVTGDTMTGNLILKGSTSATMTYADNTHPSIRFDNSDSSQNIKIMFTDYDSYRSPSGLKLIGNQGGEWFEVVGSIYSGGYFISTANGKTLTIGSQNSSWCHYSTNAPAHWFNTHVEVNGNHAPHSNNAFTSGTSSKRWSNVYSYLGNFAGAITTASTPGSWVSGMTGAAIQYRGLSAIDASSFWRFYNMKSSSGHVVCYGGLGNNIGFYGYYSGRTANGTDWSFTANTTNGNWTATASIYAAHFYENSDIQLKTNIQEILRSDNIPTIKEFDWKEDSSHGYGLIAQELEEQGYSELVSIRDDGYKTVNYSAALSLIVGKLQVKIKELEKEIEILKNKN